MVLKNVICKDHKGPRVGLPIRTAGRSFLELNEAEQQSFSRHRLVVSQPARAGFDKSSPCDAHSRCTSHRSRSPDIALVAPTPAPYLPYRLAITRSPAACTAIAADPFDICAARVSRPSQPLCAPAIVHSVFILLPHIIPFCRHTPFATLLYAALATCYYLTKYRLRVSQHQYFERQPTRHFHHHITSYRRP